MSYAKLRPRRGTKTEWELINPILMEGEIGIEFPDSGIGTGLCKFKIGDGKKTWSELEYAFNAEAATAIYGGTVDVSNDICLRYGTTTEWELANPILAKGEVVYDINVNSLKIGDGIHSFTQLSYIGGSGEFDFGDIDRDGE